MIIIMLKEKYFSHNIFHESYCFAAIAALNTRNLSTYAAYKEHDSELHYYHGICG